MQAHRLQNALKNLSDALRETEAAKGNIDGVNVYSRRQGTAPWNFLARDTGSPYVDTTPLALSQIEQGSAATRQAWGRRRFRACPDETRPANLWALLPSPFSPSRTVMDENIFAFNYEFSPNSR